MVEFYKNWLTRTHRDAAQALRDTQLQWIGQGRGPGGWAPYVLIE
jgi:hypothetical protein